MNEYLQQIKGLLSGMNNSGVKIKILLKGYRNNCLTNMAINNDPQIDYVVSYLLIRDQGIVLSDRVRAQECVIKWWCVADLLTQFCGTKNVF